MARILSKETKEVVTVKHVVRTLEGIKCDRCGRTIPTKQFRDPESRYFEVTTGHNDWGNDSCESIEHYDICPECIPLFVESYLATDGHGSAYLNIETEYCHPYEVKCDK